MKKVDKNSRKYLFFFVAFLGFFFFCFFAWWQKESVNDLSVRPDTSSKITKESESFSNSDPLKIMGEKNGKWPTMFPVFSNQETQENDLELNHWLYDPLKVFISSKEQGKATNDSSVSFNGTQKKQAVNKEPTVQNTESNKQEISEPSSDQTRPPIKEPSTTEKPIRTELILKGNYQGSISEGEANEQIVLTWLPIEEKESTTYQIEVSVDQKNFQLLETVSTPLYLYDFVTYPEKKDTLSFRVRQEQANQIRQSNVLTFKRSEEGYQDQTPDSDQDQLPDTEEAILGTNAQQSDTDNDGLTDFDEVYRFKTDPLKKDTDGNGVSDGEEDPDQDQLTNIKELSLGTEPLFNDSDTDGLIDGKEVLQFHTDPLKEDTDGDGVEEGLEVEIGTNPLVKEATFSRELTVDPNTLNDSRVIPTIQLEQLSSTQVQDMAIREVGTEHPFFSETIPGYLGSAFEFYVPGTFSSAKMTFTFDSSLATGDNFLPTIYYYNEEKQLLEEVPNQQIVGNTVQTTVQHFSTYLLLNKKEFDAVWNESILPPEEQNTGVDLVFVVDESNSMLENDPKNIRIDVIRRFLTQVREQDRVSIVGFSASARTYCSLTNDRSTIEKALDSIQSNRWGTDGSKGLKQGIDQLGNDRYKRLIFLTDGEDTTQTYPYDQLIQEANEKNVMIHTVGLGSDVQTAQLEHVAQGTKGQYFFAENADALYQEYDEIYQEIDRLKKDDNQDGILDYYMQELFEKRLVFGNGQTIYDFFALDPAKVNYEWFQQTNDFDQDGLINGQELTIRVEKNQSRTRVYADITTSPFDKDSSGDGTQDGDGTGLKWQVGKRDLALFAKLSYTSLEHWQKQYFDNGQPHLIYKDDKNDGDFDLFSKYGDSLEVRHKNHWVRDKALDTDTTPILINGVDNFNASAYINKRDKQVVLAYRGTESWIDWIGNGLWISGSHPQEYSARLFAKKIAEKYSDYEIYITGHSLGGYLSLIGSDTLSSNPRYNQQIKKTMVFNALGVSPLKMGLILRLEAYAFTGRMENYRVEYDMVSRIGIHFGQKAPAIQWNKSINDQLVTGPHEMGNFISVWSENSRNPAQMKQFYSQYDREDEVPCQN